MGNARVDPDGNWRLLTRNKASGRMTYLMISYSNATPSRLFPAKDADVSLFDQELFRNQRYRSKLRFFLRAGRQHDRARYLKPQNT